MASAFCLSRNSFSTLSISLSSSLDLMCSSFSSFNNLSSFNLCSTTTVKRDRVFETNRRCGYAFYPNKYPAVATTGIPADANTNKRSGGRCPVPPECRGTRIARRTRPGPCTRNRTTWFYLLWKPLLKDAGWLENKHKLSAWITTESNADGVGVICIGSVHFQTHIFETVKQIVTFDDRRPVRGVVLKFATSKSSTGCRLFQSKQLPFRSAAACVTAQRHLQIIIRDAQTKKNNYLLYNAVRAQLLLYGFSFFIIAP